MRYDNLTNNNAALAQREGAGFIRITQDSISNKDTVLICFMFINIKLVVTAFRVICY